MSLKIILLGGVLVMFVYLVIRFHPQIIIFLSRLILGRYNAKYVQIHKNFTGKSPYAYCIKDEFINHITGFYSESKPKQIYKATTDIEFGSLAFDSKYRKLFKLKGRPFCVNLVSNAFFDLKIFGYREELIGSRIRAHFYFIDKRFVMGEYSLKTPSNEKILELATVLQKKYLGVIKTDGDSFIIEGTNGVKVLFENTSFNLSIKYLHQGKEEVDLKLSKFWNRSIYSKPEPVADNETELMERL
jgi:hypothetical protein